MLESYFRHLPGVGSAFEQKLRAAGIFTWSDAFRAPLPCSGAKARALLAGLEESRQRLEAGDARWFGDALPPAAQWRLFAHFRKSAAYVDIETTGLSAQCSITTIALYDGQSVRTYVQGINLEAFADDILPYKLLVTWNGRGFDAPILRRVLRIPLDRGSMAHLDLLPVFRSMGFRGGLKKVEQVFGLSRGELGGVDGWAAVQLWRAYELYGDPAALRTLLAYNVEDVLSLESLAVYALERLGGHGDKHEPLPALEKKGLNPFTPDRRVLGELLGLYV
jgi:uncharacterized protein YprB with RNaseH-like and TPR domain